MTVYLRPIVMTDPARPPEAQVLAGGWCWFDRIEVLCRGRAPEIRAVTEFDLDTLAPFITPREPIAGVSLDQPSIMGILNVTPDSFSDGGRYVDPDVAVARALEMAADGAEIIDIGGESTRPGAEFVDVAEEIARTEPVVRAVNAASAVALSIDTRKAAVATAARAAGADLVNDVSGLNFDAEMAQVCVGGAVCLMHAQGSPDTMQDDPRYEDVVLDVYDALAASIAKAEAAGIARRQILVDPGIGFGKTQAHNLALLRRLSLFHGLGCGILLGASRKRFIGDISGATQAETRVYGSLAVTLAGVAQGVQMHRVHDTKATKQAMALGQAIQEKPRAI